MNRDAGMLLLGLVLVSGGCSNNSANTPPAADAPVAVVVDAAPPPPTPTITLSTAGTLGPHLVDQNGKTLYFYASDTAGTNASACAATAPTGTTPCLTNWPLFDDQAPVVGDGLVATDFTRFDRGGGVMQTTWKGRPLYYFVGDTTAGATTGEGKGGIWFVARDYDVFFALSANVTPVGAAVDKPFLTDGAGRTLYVFQLDTRNSPSVCGTTQSCATFWPIVVAPSAAVLPSTLAATDFTSATPNPAASAQPNQQQYVYKGWPLYYFKNDTVPGQVAGAQVSSWFTANPAWDATTF